MVSLFKQLFDESLPPSDLFLFNQVHHILTTCISIMCILRSIQPYLLCNFRINLFSKRLLNNYPMNSICNRDFQCIVKFFCFICYNTYINMQFDVSDFLL